MGCSHIWPLRCLERSAHVPDAQTGPRFRRLAKLYLQANALMLQVMEPASPGPVVVIADCPSAAYLPSLVASPALARCMGGAHGAQAPNGAGAPPGDAASRGAGEPCAAACVIHLAPAEVRPWPAGLGQPGGGTEPCCDSGAACIWASAWQFFSTFFMLWSAPAQVVALPEYRAWMARFSTATTHVVAAAGGGDGQAVMLASAVLQVRLAEAAFMTTCSTHRRLYQGLPQQSVHSLLCIEH